MVIVTTRGARESKWCVQYGDGDGVQNQEIGKVVSQNRITSIAVVESY